RPDGDELEVEPPPLLAPGRRRCRRRSVPERCERPMTTNMSVRSVAILGAGTMGAQIAAHFANAGIPSLLLDLTSDVARKGLERARALRPDPFFTPDSSTLVTVGGFDNDLQRLAGVDWIIEAIIESLEAKQ